MFICYIPPTTAFTFSFPKRFVHVFSREISWDTFSGFLPERFSESIETIIIVESFIGMTISQVIMRKNPHSRWYDQDHFDLFLSFLLKGNLFVDTREISQGSELISFNFRDTCFAFETDVLRLPRCERTVDCHQKIELECHLSWHINLKTN